MTELEKQKLYDRNNKIIQIILEEIDNQCPGSVDLIGIGGSFCSGDIYERSDLDLAIIVNNKEATSILNKCFILENVGFDIYTQEWENFEKMAEYNNPYVTKLFDLNIVYSKDESILKKYEKLQQKVRDNMQNTRVVSKKIGKHFIEAMRCYRKICETSDISIGYKSLAKLISEIEYILYMINKTYIKRGTKRIPEEISNMNILPDGFLEIYLDIVNCTTLEDIKCKSKSLITNVSALLEEQGIEYKKEESQKEETISVKVAINADVLTGTYEEIYSNYKNKMYHAYNTGNKYLSFVTMASCQQFYDDMIFQYDIPAINLIGNYTPNDLAKNADSFEKAMIEWKKLYDLFNKRVVTFNSLEELETLYNKK